MLRLVSIIYRFEKVRICEQNVSLFRKSPLFVIQHINKNLRTNIL